MADDGTAFLDYRKPYNILDQSAVTLASTLKALYPAGAFPVLGGQYWWAGKKAKLRVFGKITTGTTPGNLVLQLNYGTGADANGTAIVASAAIALVASQTNLSWEVELYISCRSIGSSGTFFGDGHARFNPAVIASTAQPIMMPASAAAVSSAVDLTAANILSLQASRSGSTAETMTVQDIDFVPYN